MSWRNVVDLIAKHGPQTWCALQLRTEGDVRTHLREAGLQGLVHMPGHCTGNRRWVYSLTPLGRLWVEGKAVYTVAPQTRPGARPGMCVRPSWLASLPPGNEIRLHQQPSTF